MTPAELEAALDRLGWRVSDGPTRTASGWKATAQKGPAWIMTTSATAIGVIVDLLRKLEDLLRMAELHAKEGS